MTHLVRAQYWLADRAPESIKGGCFRYSDNPVTNWLVLCELISPFNLHSTVFTGLFHLWTHKLSWAQIGRWFSYYKVNGLLCFSFFFWWVFFFICLWESHCWNCAFPCIKSSFLICLSRPLAKYTAQLSLIVSSLSPRVKQCHCEGIFCRRYCVIVRNCWRYPAFLLM